MSADTDQSGLVTFGNTTCQWEVWGKRQRLQVKLHLTLFWGQKGLRSPNKALRTSDGWAGEAAGRWQKVIFFILLPRTLKVTPPDEKSFFFVFLQQLNVWASPCGKKHAEFDTELLKVKMFPSLTDSLDFRINLLLCLFFFFVPSQVKCIAVCDGVCIRYL